MSEMTSGLVERADRRGGLTIEMEDVEPANLLVADTHVYITQNGSLIYITREAAVTMAWSILASVEPARAPLPAPPAKDTI
jgi:hypothetical protein